MSRDPKTYSSKRPAMYEKNYDDLNYSANILSSPLLECRADFPDLLMLSDVTVINI